MLLESSLSCRRKAGKGSWNSGVKAWWLLEEKEKWLLSFWALLLSVGAAIQNVPSKRQGLAYQAIPTAGKADALPGCPRKAAAGSSASTRAVITCQPNDPDGFLFCLSLKPPLDPHSQFGKWGGTGMTKAQWHYGQSSRQTSRCRWVFSGGNVMMEECSCCQRRQQVTEALEILRIYLQYQLFPYILFWL